MVGVTMTKGIKSAVAYSRVSTLHQADHGDSLDGQAERIRSWALEKGIVLHGIYQDTASAYRDRGAQRHDLLDAIRVARDQQIPLVVTSIDRLSRRLEDILDLDLKSIDIIPLDLGQKISKADLRRRIQAAQIEAETRARQGRDRSKLPPNLSPEARRRGAMANLDRASRNTETILRHLHTTPGLEAMSWQKRADHMNAQGDLNCTSLRNNQFSPWTRHSIREPFQRARKELEFEKEMDEHDPEDDFLSSEGSWEKPLSSRIPGARPQRPERELPDASSVGTVPDPETDIAEVDPAIDASSITTQDEASWGGARMATPIWKLVSALGRLPNQIRRFLSK